MHAATWPPHLQAALQLRHLRKCFKAYSECVGWRCGCIEACELLHNVPRTQSCVLQCVVQQHVHSFIPHGAVGYCHVDATCRGWVAARAYAGDSVRVKWVRRTIFLPALNAGDVQWRVNVRARCIARQRAQLWQASTGKQCFGANTASLLHAFFEKQCGPAHG